MAAAATAAMIRQRTLFPLTEQTHNIIKYRLTHLRQGRRRINQMPFLEGTFCLYVH